MPVEGFSNIEEEIFDKYGKQYSKEQYNDYITSIHIFSKKLFRFEKVQKFYSLVTIPIIYNNKNYKFTIKIPLDEITLRMRFYNKKSTKIYLREK